jgi:hypothetical protein
MKSKGVLFILMILVSSFLLSFRVSAQDTLVPPPDKKNILKLDLIWIVGESVFLSYERVLSEDASLQFGLMFGSAMNLGTASYRYYLSETAAPKGIFVSPIVGLGAIDEPVVGAGLMVGSQAYFKNKITLDAYLGPAYGSEGGDGGFIFFGGLSIGVAF